MQNCKRNGSDLAPGHYGNGILELGGSNIEAPDSVSGSHNLGVAQNY